MWYKNDSCLNSVWTLHHAELETLAQNYPEQFCEREITQQIFLILSTVKWFVTAKWNCPAAIISKKKSSSSVQWEGTIYYVREIYSIHLNLGAFLQFEILERFPAVWSLLSCRKLAWPRDISSAPPHLAPLTNRGCTFGSDTHKTNKQIKEIIFAYLWQLALEL